MCVSIREVLAGLHSQNIHRDLMQRVIRPILKRSADGHVEYPLTCKSLKRTADGDPIMVQAIHGLIAPFNVVADLWQFRRKSFYKRLLGPNVNVEADIPGVLETFWSAVPASDPRLGPLVDAYVRAGDQFAAMFIAIMYTKGVHAHEV